MLPNFYNSLMGSGSSTSLSNTNPLQSNLSSSGVVVTVTNGDILLSDCEVLINTTDANFDLTGIVIDVH